MTSAEPARSSIRRRVLAGEPLFGAFLVLASPLGAELAGRAGFDWLIVDLEHGGGSEADLLPQLYAIESAYTLASARSARRKRFSRSSAAARASWAVMPK